MFYFRYLLAHIHCGGGEDGKRGGGERGFIIVIPMIIIIITYITKLFSGKCGSTRRPF